MKAMLNPDRLTGKRVNHVVFGRGRILRVQDGYMHVSFGGVERMFEYPAAFSQYMTIEDKRLRPLLPECVPAQRTPAPRATCAGRPRALCAMSTTPSSWPIWSSVPYNSIIMA